MGKNFEYILEDFLEVKASVAPHRTKPLKKFLYAQGVKGELFVVEGFVLQDQIVLINPNLPASFEHLVFLNPKSGAIWVRKLRKD